MPGVKLLIRRLRQLQLTDFTWKKHIYLMRRYSNETDYPMYMGEMHQPQQQVTGGRAVGLTQGDQIRRYLLPPDTPPDARILNVAVLGSPNAGKSTLTNALMGWKINSVSSKVHTTRHNALNILTENNKQIMFVDTPGVVNRGIKSRYKLDSAMTSGPSVSASEVDLLCVVIDVSNAHTRYTIDRSVIQILKENIQTPSVLVLNKVDAINKRAILLHLTQVLTTSLVDNQRIPVQSHRQELPVKTVRGISKELDQLEKKYGKLEKINKQIDNVSADTVRTETILEQRDNNNTVKQADDSDKDSRRILHEDDNEEEEDRRGWAHFKRVFMVSALNGSGVSQMKDYLLSSAKPGEWKYHSSLVTDQNPQELACRCVWEKMLDYLPKDIPYRLFPIVVLWDLEDECLNILMNIHTTNKRDTSNILGREGYIIKKIARQAEQEIMNLFRINVELLLSVKMDTR